MYFTLDEDEKIIYENTEVECSDKPHQYLEKLILTNKKVVGILETSTGPYTSSITEVDEIPLTNIQISDGKPAVHYINSATLQICLKNGVCRNFIFLENPKVEIPKWINSIKENLFEAGDKEAREEKNKKDFEKVKSTSANSKPYIRRKMVTKNAQCKGENKGKKCMACGMPLPSVTAICPSCGCEVNNKKVSDALNAFVRKIEEYDDSINKQADSLEYGWKSWSIMKKTGWIILNFIFVCYPLIIYLLVKHAGPHLLIQSKPKLTANENRKVNFIENYTFPNDREAILDALLFIKGKITYLSSEKINQKNQYWIKVWYNKAIHLYSKAEILFPGDTIVQTVWNDMNDKISRVNKRARIRGIVGFAVAVILVANVAINGLYSGGWFDSEYKRTYEWPTSGISQQLPLPQTNYGTIFSDDEQCFTLTMYKVNQEQFENYVKACISSGFNLYSSKSECSYDAYNAEEYNLDIYYYEYSDELRIQLEAPMSMSEIYWPTSKLVKKIPVPESFSGNIQHERDDYFSVYLENITAEGYAAYVTACMDNGFSIDYSRDEDYFSAYNKKGDHIVVKKEPFDKMYLAIDKEE